jgi:hypothetical protein
MNLLNFVPGFIGALTGLAVYQLLIRPLVITIYTRLKARREAYQIVRCKREHLEGMAWAWGVWGTGQITFNSLDGYLYGGTPYVQGFNQALKDIRPLEEERRSRKYQRETS